MSRFVRVPVLGGQQLNNHAQILTDLQAKLRDDPAYLAPAITEAWLRRYQVSSFPSIIKEHNLRFPQVLPGRTHPLMNAAGTGGHILHTIKVFVRPICFVFQT